MNNTEIRSQLALATDIINRVRDSFESVITTEAEFDTALASSAVTINVSPEFTYSKPLVINRLVNINNASLLSSSIARANFTDKQPVFSGGMIVQAQVTGYGLEIHGTADSVLNINGAVGPRFTQCKILGDTNKRGIRANGGNMAFIGCYIAGFKRIGQDTQAIFTSDMTAPGLLVDNCYIEAAGENFMAGGEDPSQESHIPSLITFRNCDFSKDPNWYALGIQLKNTFELKNAKGVQVLNCRMKYSGGISEGQASAFFVFTPRNQSTTAPYSTIEDVLVKDCICDIGGACIVMQGSDNNVGHPSRTMKNVMFDNIHFTNIDPLGITKGTGRAFTFLRAPENITLQNITVGGKLKAAGYLIAPAPVKLTLKNIKVPTSTYDWKIDAGLSGIPAWKTLMPDSTIEVTLADTGSTI